MLKTPHRTGTHSLCGVATQVVDYSREVIMSSSNLDGDLLMLTRLYIYIYVCIYKLLFTHTYMYIYIHTWYQSNFFTKKDCSEQSVVLLDKYMIYLTKQLKTQLRIPATGVYLSRVLLRISDPWKTEPHTLMAGKEQGDKHPYPDRRSSPAKKIRRASDISHETTIPF